MATTAWTPREEPVTLVAAVTAAALATVNLVGLLASWDEATLAAVNLVVAAWIGVIGAWVRQKVTPNSRVALTQHELELIEAGRNEGVR